MSKQREQAELFHQLHRKGEPLVLFNCWDAGSAKAVAASGAKAIATGSWSVATAHGYDDGEALPLDLVLANLARIVASVTVPVTLDFEGGYDRDAAALAQNASKVIAVGAIGINFEDRIVDGEGLYTISEQCTRIAAIRAAATQAGVPLFINARTDIFLNAEASTHSPGHLQEAIDRARAYAEAGASGFFAPGLRDGNLIQRLCASVPLPVNIMMANGMLSVNALAELGVARVSYGPGPYRLAMAALQAAASDALKGL